MTDAPHISPSTETATLEQLQDLQRRAGIPHLPTQLTFEARNAVSREGPRSYDWEDKPHRLVYDLCREIERINADAQGASASAETSHDSRVFFVCQCCEEHAPENGVNCREDIGVMPDGTWLCDGCYSDCDKSAYGLIASDVDDFEFPRFEDLPRPVSYSVAANPSTAKTEDAQPGVTSPLIARPPITSRG
jgi:hypothetical protein